METLAKPRWSDNPAEYNRWYRQQNRERQALYAKRHHATQKNWLQSLKEGQPCTECGEYYPAVALDWHHLDDDKLFTVSSNARRSKASLMEEISKCILLCANCHRIHHYGKPT